MKTNQFGTVTQKTGQFKSTLALVISLLAFLICSVSDFAASEASAALYYNSSEPMCNGSDSTVVWCDDFEDGDWIVTNCDIGGPGDSRNDGWCGTIFYVPDPLGTNFGRCGGKGVAGTNCSAGSGLHVGIGNAEMGDHNLGPSQTSYSELYVRYYIRPLPGYVWGHEKMLTFNLCCAGGGGIYFGTISSYFGSGTPTFYNAAADAWLPQNQGNDVTMVPGNWYYMEVHIKLGAGSGVYELWLDNCGVNGLGCTGPGTLRARHTNVTFASGQIGTIWLENWANAPSIGETYYDQLVAATRRIGPMGVGSGDTTPPSTPTGLFVQ